MIVRTYTLKPTQSVLTAKKTIIAGWMLSRAHIVLVFVLYSHSGIQD